MGQLLLGIDVGTYSSKGVIVDAGGKVLRSIVVAHTNYLTYFYGEVSKYQPLNQN
jgi:sugar (pentulose or hexulose) kinase